jgi:hypothetical protein
MKFLTFILIFILFYFALKGIRFLWNVFSVTGNPEDRHANQNSRQKDKSSIDKKDIIEAEFEDIDESEKDKQKPDS